MEYHVLFEQLLKKLNTMDSPDFSRLQQELRGVCDILRITKIMTITYPNARLEALGKGETAVSYDSGEEGVVGFSRRIVNEMMNIVECNIFVRKDAEKWSNDEREKAMLLIQTMSVYVSRTKIKDAADRFAFFDEKGYHNLRYLIKYMQVSAQKGELAGKVAMHFNLRHFSLVNQQIGRELGGFVMHGFFNGIEQLIGDKGEVCRVGGDNFACIFSRDLMDDVLGYLSGTAVVFDVNTGDRIKVSASVGVYEIPDDFVLNDIGDIMDRIISASHVAKNSGKSEVVFFSEELITNKEKSMHILHLFPEALEKEEFRVFYQPKVDIITGELRGAEALCRWFRDGKIVPPLDFIPILEQGLEVCKLDFYMLDHVCRDIRRWLAEGRDVVRVSVNLSRKHMADIDLLEHILEIIDRNGVPHEYLEVELTETTTDVEFRDLKRVVSGLRTAGIYTSVDDFGMGYSSLNLIKEVPWDVLKVDRGFLPEDENDENETRRIMFKHVIAMAKDMGMECIAEGVETRSQIELMKNNHCDLAQGFYFDRPLPVYEFEKRMDTHRYNID